MIPKLAVVLLAGILGVGAILLNTQGQKAAQCPDQCQTQIDTLKQQVSQQQQQSLKATISATPSFNAISDGNKGPRTLWSSPAGSKIVFAAVALTELHIPPEHTMKISDMSTATSPSARGRIQGTASYLGQPCAYIFTTQDNTITWSQENCTYPTGGDVYFRVDVIYQ
jgi:hypothetical protein